MYNIHLVVSLVIKPVDISGPVKPPHELDVLLHPCSDIHGTREHKCTSIRPKNSQKIKEMPNSATETQMHGYYNISTEMAADQAIGKMLEGAMILRDGLIFKANCLLIYRRQNKCLIC
jgi:hypothetical protein